MDELTVKETKKVARSTGRKVMNAILRGEDAGTLLEYVWKDEIMPWIGDSLQEACGRAIGAIFYDDDYIYERSARSRRHDRDRRHDYTSHSRKSRDRDRDRRRRRDDDDDYDRSDLGPRDTDLAPFDTRGEAEDCVREMVRLIKSKGHAEVRDFYSEANVVTTNFTVQDWGWTSADSVRRAQIRQSRGKYYIYMPKPVELEDEYDD